MNANESSIHLDLADDAPDLTAPEWQVKFANTSVERGHKAHSVGGETQLRREFSSHTSAELAEIGVREAIYSATHRASILNLFRLIPTLQLHT